MDTFLGLLSSIEAHATNHLLCPSLFLAGVKLYEVYFILMIIDWSVATLSKSYSIMPVSDSNVRPKSSTLALDQITNCIRKLRWYFVQNYHWPYQEHYNVEIDLKSIFTKGCMLTRSSFSPICAGSYCQRTSPKKFSSQWVSLWTTEIARRYTSKYGFFTM